MDQAAVLRELKVNLGLPWEKLSQSFTASPSEYNFPRQPV